MLVMLAIFFEVILDLIELTKCVKTDHCKDFKLLMIENIIVASKVRYSYVMYNLYEDIWDFFHAI